MKRHVGWSGVVALALLSGAFSLWSCGGGTNSTNSSPTPPTQQFVLNPVGTTSNAGSLIIGVSRESIDANRADRIDVFAQALDPAGRPLTGIPILFQAQFPDANFIPPVPNDFAFDIFFQGLFPAGLGFTDGNGVATTTLQAPATPGRMAITAQTIRNMGLSALMFVQVFDVGFVPTENDIVVVIPSEIAVTDPSPGTTLEFAILGGVPFTNQDPGDVDDPYVLQNAESGIGTAELVFDGTFPATVVYTLSGKVSGTHTFTILDSEGHSATASVTVEFTELEITPTSVTLFVGSSQVFALSGGVPPYTCSASGGTISPMVINERGGTFTFTASEVPLSATFNILCNDQSGQVVTATVSIDPLPSPTGGGGPTPVPTASREAARVLVAASPPTLNGPDGGTSLITATVLDQSFNPLAGVPVVWTLPGQVGTPTPEIPSLSVLTGISDANGQVSTTLTVPSGTPPQFIIITAETDNGISGSGQVGITSQTTEPAGEPDHISAAVLRQDACQLNQDGTLTAIITALVSDENNNPVATGVQVNWGPVTPVARAEVVSPSFTNSAAPCDVSQYRAECRDSGALLTISPQPGTATTCFIFDADLAGQLASVRATVAGTNITTNTVFQLPAPPAAPTPTPQPPAQPTPSPGPPSILPANANLNVGQSQAFVISGGVPPYTVVPSGGTATPTTVPDSGGAFNYTATTPGMFTIVVSDSNGQVDSAMVTNTAGSAIQVDEPGPVNVPFNGSQSITITGGGTPPYTVTLAGGLTGSISGSPLPAPGTFTYDAPNMPTNGQIVITDSAGTPNTRSITVLVP